MKVNTTTKTNNKLLAKIRELRFQEARKLLNQLEKSKQLKHGALK